MGWVDFITLRSSLFAKKSRGKAGSGKQCATIISFVMCKGGVGKTTSTRLLAEEIARLGNHVLIIDADPQGNLTTSFRLSNLGFTIDESTPVLADIISDQADFPEAVCTVSNNISLVPSTAINSLSDKIMERGKVSIRSLRQKLEPLLFDYDFIFFDTAPSLSLLNASIIVSSDLVIHPVCLDEFSRNGLIQTLQEVSALAKKFKTNIDSKILVNRFSDDKLSQYYLAFIIQNYPALVFNTMIRESLDIRERIISEGSSLAEADYNLLAKELVLIKEAEVLANA